MPSTRLDTPVTEWIKVARIFHHDFLRYGERQSRIARDQALKNARYVRDLSAPYEHTAKRLAALTGRDWSDCGAYERQAFLDMARTR